MKQLLSTAATAIACFAPTLPTQQPGADEALVRRELGAANFVPADCAFFSTTLRAKEQWQLLRDSNAWRELSALPGAVMALVAQQRWHDLAELAACRELLDDPTFRADLDALRDGDLTALYRVQKNPRFLAFFDSERVQALLPGLRPSAMAAGVRAAAAELAAQRR